MKFVQRFESVAALLLLSIAASLPWLTVVSGPRAQISLALAILVGVVCGQGILRAVLGLKTRYLDSTAAVLLLGLTFNFVTTGTPSQPSQIVHGLSGGLSRISTSILPVHGPGWIFVAPVALVATTAWMASFFSGKKKYALVGPLPLAANFLVASGFGSLNNGANAVLGLVVCATTLAWLSRRNVALRTYVARELDQQWWQRAPRLLAPIVLIGIVTSGFVYVQRHYLAFSGTPASINRVTPDQSLAGQNPSLILATLRYSSSKVPLYRLSQPVGPSSVSHGHGPQPPVLIPIATLSTYNNQQWVLGSFLPVNNGDGVALLRHLDTWTPKHGSPRTIRVTILAGATNSGLNRFFPVPGGLLAGSDAPQVNVDPQSGIGVNAQLASTGSTITVESESDAIAPQVPSLNSTPLSPRECIELLAFLGQKGTTCPSTKIPNALNLIGNVVHSLRTSYGLTPVGGALADRAGQSFGDILSSILGPNHMGTPEQYATFVALLARAVGLDSRIETGFRAPASATVLTPAMSYTWAEIYSGNGWVVEDATPTKVGHGAPQSASFSKPSNTKTSNGGDCAGGTCTVIIRKVPKPGATQAPASMLQRDLIIGGEIVGGLVSAVLLWALVVAVLRNRRRSRRWRGTPAQMVRGSLRELVDARRELGVGGAMATATTTEIIDAVLQDFDNERLLVDPTVTDAINAAFFDTTETLSLPAEHVVQWVKIVTKLYWSEATLGMRIRGALRYSRIA